jgi:hypothetical protein
MCNSFGIYSQAPTMRFHGNARGAYWDISYLTSIPHDKKVYHYLITYMLHNALRSEAIPDNPVDGRIHSSLRQSITLRYGVTHPVTGRGGP